MAGRVGLDLLVLAAMLSLSCGSLHGRNSGKETARVFVKRRDPSPPIDPPLDLRERLAEAKPFSYPATELGTRATRSDGGTCGLKKSAVLETDPVSPYFTATYPVIYVTNSVNCVLQVPLSETAEAIQAVWVENDVSDQNPPSNGWHSNLQFHL